MSKWHIGGIVLCTGLIGLGAVTLWSHTPKPSQAQQPETTAEVSPAAARPRVLLVHSYHAGYPWVDAITRGVRMASPASEVDLQVVYMDTKRHTDEPFKQRTGEEMRRVLAEWRPRVLIAADDNAQEYVATSYLGDEEIQIVFCGVNADPQKYGYPTKNVTGVLERPHYRESVALLRRLVPEARRIALLSDNSPTSAGALKFMCDEGTDSEIITKEMVTTFTQWKDAVRRLQDSADAIAVYMYHTLKGPDSDKSLDPTMVMDWTVRHSSVPVVGFFIFTVDDGALCGYLESGVEHGRRAGRMALDILNGKTADECPMVTALAGQSMLNLKTARALNLTVPQSVIADIDVLVEE